MEYSADLLAVNQSPGKFHDTLKAFVAPVAKATDAVASDPVALRVAQAVCAAFGDSGGSNGMTRSELAQRYAQNTGRDVSNIVFYLVFARFKVAVIVQQIYYRYHVGLTKDPRFAAMPEVVQILLHYSWHAAQSGKV